MQSHATFTALDHGPASTDHNMLASRSATVSGGPRCSGAPPQPAASLAARRRVVAGATPEVPPELQKAMQDPKMQAQMKAMQEAMARPEVQQEMAAMQAYMQNQQVQERMKALRDDPEFQQMFQEIQSGGMGALMKYMNDPKMLAKVGERLGDVQVAAPPPGTGAAAGGAAAAAAAAGGGAPGVPEIDNIFDAAKYGDMEAIEDFIAIGKDVNEGDKEARRPLHYAAGFNHLGIAQLLLAEGAQLEVADSKGNTPLHYAAGYGRAKLVELLLSAGASAKAKNEQGKTPLDLAIADDRNPLNQAPDVMQKLQQATVA